ncbi:hypothetical protein ACEPAH_8432 [Sanghuangporus vaninii]
MSRVLLEQIRSLTLYKGELTKARRLSPIQQLKCVGKACKLFQPDVVRCYNNGGSGTDIDWTCEADLPEKLRFGRVDVSCEGWSRPGDPYVLKGSCGLEYRLINTSENQSSLGWFKNIAWNEWLERGFLWLIVLLAIYFLFGSYIWRFLRWLRRSTGFGPSGSRPSGSSSSGPRSNWFTWGHRGNSGRRPPPDYPPPPPPYSEHPKSSYSNSSSAPNSSGPGFWSGFGLGSLGGLAAGRVFGRGGGEGWTPRQPRFATTQEYDWERERQGRGGGLFGSSPWSFPGTSSSFTTSRPAAGADRQPSARATNSDRGEGPSNLGRMRRSTGYGVTNVR